MVNDTTWLLDRDGVAVERVERLGDGTRRVHVITAEAGARACPGGGVVATRVRGSAVTKPRDLPYGERGLEPIWRKRRWWCDELGCERASFPGQIPQIPAGARLTERLRQAAGRAVRDAGATVVPAARDFRLSWPVVMASFREVAGEVTEAPLPPVTVLGIDETRRGKMRWEQDEATGRWRPTRDRWHTGFVDAAAGGGLLGQVEGRAAADVLAWLAPTPPPWRQAITHVAIDMSPSYKAAIRTGLPHATIVVDHFHGVQLATKMLSPVRRRLTSSVRGRRGRASDPEWKARRGLLRNREDLTDEQFERMWNPLLDEGPIGQTLLTAWIAKENLRSLPALARTGADRHAIGHARYQFRTWCADADIPEVRQLARTIDRWWPEIEAFISTGLSNAKSEGINRVIKFAGRAAYGFRNAAHQRLRPRCVTTRRARGHLRTA